MRPASDATDKSRNGKHDASRRGALGRQVTTMIGLALLLFGLLLVDRSFATWRNDPRTLPDVNGLRLPVGTQGSSAFFFEKHPHTVEAAFALGVGFLLGSVVLFGWYPVEK